MERKKLIIRFLSAVIVMVAIVFILLKLSTATVSVTSDNAEIFVKQGNADFTSIGRGEAKFKTRSSELVYIEARNQSGTSQTNVKPMKARTTRVNLPIEPLTQANFIAPGPLVYPHIENGFIYGINPHTNSLDVRPIADNASPAPFLPNLPFLKQVAWLNSQDYVYITAGRGAGTVSNRPKDQDAHQNLLYTALASPNPSSLVLLAADGVYLSKNFDIQEATKIALLIDNSSPIILADNSQIYFASLIFEPSTAEDDEPDGQETKLIVFSQTGQKVHEFTLPITESVYRIAALNDTTLVLLSQSGLTLLDTSTGKTRTEAFSFGKVGDLLVFDGRLLLLGGSGLWEYNKSTNEYHKVAAYPEGEEYVQNSLAQIGDQIYFSTSVKDEELLKDSTAAKSGIYQLNLR